MTEVHALGAALKAKSAEGDAKLEAAIVRLKAELGDLQAGIERLVGAKTLLTDEAIVRIGRTVADVLKDVRGCSTAAAGRLSSLLKNPWRFVFGSEFMALLMRGQDARTI